MLPARRSAVLSDRSAGAGAAGRRSSVVELSRLLKKAIRPITPTTAIATARRVPASLRMAAPIQARVASPARMGIPGDPHDERIASLHEATLAQAGTPLEFFDAHTHLGHHDPDGYTATPAEIVAGLDRGGQQRALIFPMQEPGGYPVANDAAIAAARESGGRLEALARIDPKTGEAAALAEARRCLEAGARGFKLHPRSDAFDLPHPVVEQIVALAGEHRAPVLFH